VSPQARPLYLLGSRRLDELGTRIQQVLPALARDWWRQESCIQLVAVSVFNETLRSSSLRYVLRGGSAGEWLAFLGTEQAWLKLAESWLGCEVVADTPLVGALRREFCLSFFRQLLEPAASAVMVLEQASWSDIPACALQLGGGAVVIELDVEGIPVIVLAPITLWPDLAAWPASASPISVQPVAAGLADTALQVEVRLPSVRVSMADIGTLAVGDFLDLGHDLSGRVRVMSAAAPFELAAVLGQHEQHKAISIGHHDGAG
jgi:hypothetical protein